MYGCSYDVQETKTNHLKFDSSRQTKDKGRLHASTFVILDTNMSSASPNPPPYTRDFNFIWTRLLLRDGALCRSILNFNVQINRVLNPSSDIYQIINVDRVQRIMTRNGLASSGNIVKDLDLLLSAIEHNKLPIKTSDYNAEVVGNWLSLWKKTNQIVYDVFETPFMIQDVLITSEAVYAYDIRDHTKTVQRVHLIRFDWSYLDAKRSHEERATATATATATTELQKVSSTHAATNRHTSSSNSRQPNPASLLNTNRPTMNTNACNLLQERSQTTSRAVVAINKASASSYHSSSSAAAAAAASPANMVSTSQIYQSQNNNNTQEIGMTTVHRRPAVPFADWCQSYVEGTQYEVADYIYKLRDDENQYWFLVRWEPPVQYRSHFDTNELVCVSWLPQSDVGVKQEENSNLVTPKAVQWIVDNTPHIPASQLKNQDVEARMKEARNNVLHHYRASASAPDRFGDDGQWSVSKEMANTLFQTGTRSLNIHPSQCVILVLDGQKLQTSHSLIHKDIAHASNIYVANLSSTPDQYRLADALKIHLYAQTVRAFLVTAQHNLQFDAIWLDYCGTFSRFEDDYHVLFRTKRLKANSVLAITHSPREAKPSYAVSTTVLKLTIERVIDIAQKHGYQLTVQNKMSYSSVYFVLFKVTC